MLPPGDLRMALVALAGDDPQHRRWAELLTIVVGASDLRLVMRTLRDEPELVKDVEESLKFDK